MATELLIWDILKRQGRSIVWLAEQTHSSKWNVYHFKLGDREIPADFQLRCELLLGVPRSILFSTIKHSEG